MDAASSPQTAQHNDRYIHVAISYGDPEPLPLSTLPSLAYRKEFDSLGHLSCCQSYSYRETITAEPVVAFGSSLKSLKLQLLSPNNILNPEAWMFHLGLFWGPGVFAAWMSRSLAWSTGLQSVIFFCLPQAPLAAVEVVCSGIPLPWETTR